jgi:hypothetical protein
MHFWQYPASSSTNSGQLRVRYALALASRFREASPVLALPPDETSTGIMYSLARLWLAEMSAAPRTLMSGTILKELWNLKRELNFTMLNSVA